MASKKSFWTSIPFHILLFLLTFFTTTVAGVFWLNKDPFDLENFHYGIPYATALLFILACHEFGHYFAARYHKVESTLPYFIPFPMVPSIMGIFLLNFGTFGAVIRTRSVVPNKRAMFDIGVAGPLAGFVASVAVLIYGFTHLPGTEFILSIHPDYNFATNASSHANGISLSFGSTLLYSALQQIFTHPDQFVPPMTEIYHYPFLCVGWFGLFVTALNLIPMGQFDGGHVIYAMFGNAHKKIARVVSTLLIILGAPALLDAFLRILLAVIFKKEYGPLIPFVQYSWSGWLVWALIAIYVIKIYHPPVPDETEIDPLRKLIGWITIGVFIVSFSLIPFSVE
ncbi:MAG: site-2 protease family protein [Bacteroidetes bacterium]|nr:site-2 protease family protein [Bacteroidota bacterium]